MPNHITTEIRSSKAVIDALINDSGKVDFELIVPAPADMFRGALGLGDREAHPINWHDWQTENWGTKWNAYKSDRISDTAVKFQTAWDAPVPVIIALAEKFPDEIITVISANEDTSRGLWYVQRWEKIQAFQPLPNTEHLVELFLDGYDDFVSYREEYEEEGDGEMFREKLALMDNAKSAWEKEYAREVPRRAVLASL